MLRSFSANEILEALQKKYGCQPEHSAVRSGTAAAGAFGNAAEPGGAVTEPFIFGGGGSGGGASTDGSSYGGVAAAAGGGAELFVLASHLNMFCSGDTDRHGASALRWSVGAATARAAAACGDVEVARGMVTLLLRAFRERRVRNSNTEGKDTCKLAGSRAEAEAEAQVVTIGYDLLLNQERSRLEAGWLAQRVSGSLSALDGNDAEGDGTSQGADIDKESAAAGKDANSLWWSAEGDSAGAAADDDSADDARADIDWLLSDVAWANGLAAEVEDAGASIAAEMDRCDEVGLAETKMLHTLNFYAKIFGCGKGLRRAARRLRQRTARRRRRREQRSTAFKKAKQCSVAGIRVGDGGSFGAGAGAAVGALLGGIGDGVSVAAGAAEKGLAELTGTLDATASATIGLATRLGAGHTLSAGLSTLAGGAEGLLGIGSGLVGGVGGLVKGALEAEMRREAKEAEAAQADAPVAQADAPVAQAVEPVGDSSVNTPGCNTLGEGHADVEMRGADTTDTADQGEGDQAESVEERTKRLAALAAAGWTALAKRHALRAARDAKRYRDLQVSISQLAVLRADVSAALGARVLYQADSILLADVTAALQGAEYAEGPDAHYLRFDSNGDKRWHVCAAARAGAGACRVGAAVEALETRRTQAIASAACAGAVAATIGLGQGPCTAGTANGNAGGALNAGSMDAARLSASALLSMASGIAVASKDEHCQELAMSFARMPMPPRGEAAAARSCAEASAVVSSLAVRSQSWSSVDSEAKRGDGVTLTDINSSINASLLCAGAALAAVPALSTAPVSGALWNRRTLGPAYSLVTAPAAVRARAGPRALLGSRSVMLAGCEFTGGVHGPFDGAWRHLCGSTDTGVELGCSEGEQAADVALSSLLALLLVPSDPRRAPGAVAMPTISSKSKRKSKSGQRKQPPAEEASYDSLAKSGPEHAVWLLEALLLQCPDVDAAVALSKSAAVSTTAEPAASIANAESVLRTAVARAEVAARALAIAAHHSCHCGIVDAQLLSFDLALLVRRTVRSILEEVAEREAEGRRAAQPSDSQAGEGGLETSWFVAHAQRMAAWATMLKSALIGLRDNTSAQVQSQIDAGSAQASTKVAAAAAARAAEKCKLAAQRAWQAAGSAAVHAAASAKLAEVAVNSAIRKSANATVLQCQTRGILARQQIVDRATAAVGAVFGPSLDGPLFRCDVDYRRAAVLSVLHMMYDRHSSSEDCGMHNAVAAAYAAVRLVSLAYARQGTQASVDRLAAAMEFAEALFRVRAPRAADANESKEEEAARFRRRLELFYSTYNAANLVNVPEVAEQWHDDENRCIAQLCSKYEVDQAAEAIAHEEAEARWVSAKEVVAVAAESVVALERELKLQRGCDGRWGAWQCLTSSPLVAIQHFAMPCFEAALRSDPDDTSMQNVRWDRLGLLCRLLLETLVLIMAGTEQEGEVRDAGVTPEDVAQTCSAVQAHSGVIRLLLSPPLSDWEPAVGLDYAVLTASGGDANEVGAVSDGPLAPPPAPARSLLRAPPDTPSTGARTALLSVYIAARPASAETTTAEDDSADEKSMVARRVALLAFARGSCGYTSLEADAARAAASCCAAAAFAAASAADHAAENAITLANAASETEAASARARARIAAQTHEADAQNQTSLTKQGGQNAGDGGGGGLLSSVLRERLQSDGSAATAEVPAASQQQVRVVSREALVAFYSEVEPSKVGNVDQVLGMFSTEEILSTLQEKYGRQPAFTLEIAEPETKFSEGGLFSFGSNLIKEITDATVAAEKPAMDMGGLMAGLRTTLAHEVDGDTDAPAGEGPLSKGADDGGAYVAELRAQVVSAVTAGASGVVSEKGLATLLKQLARQLDRAVAGDGDDGASVSARVSKVQASFLSKLAKRHAAKQERTQSSASGGDSASGDSAGGDAAAAAPAAAVRQGAEAVLHARVEDCAVVADVHNEAEAAEVLAQERELAYVEALAASRADVQRDTDVLLPAVLRGLDPLDAATATAEAAALCLGGSGSADLLLVWSSAWKDLEALIEQEVSSLLGLQGSAADAATGRAARLLRRLCELLSSVAAATLAAHATFTGSADIVLATPDVMAIDTASAAPIALLVRVVALLEPGTAWALAPTEQAWLLQQLRMVPRVARVQAVAFAGRDGTVFSTEKLHRAWCSSRLSCAHVRLALIDGLEKAL